MTHTLRLDVAWMPIQSRPGSPVVAGLYSVASTNLAALDSALASLASVVPAQLRPTGMAGLVWCTSDESLRLVKASIDTVWSNAAGITSDADMVSWSPNLIRIDATDVQSAAVGAVALVHEWGHAVDFHVKRAFNRPGGGLTLGRQYQDDFAAVWAQVSAIRDQTTAALGAAVYGQSTISECWAEVFRCRLLERAGLAPTYFAGRTPTQELQVITTGQVGVENAVTAAARVVIDDLVTTGLPSLHPVAYRVVPPAVPTLGATVVAPAPAEVARPLTVSVPTLGCAVSQIAAAALAAGVQPTPPTLTGLVVASTATPVTTTVPTAAAQLAGAAAAVPATTVVATLGAAAPALAGAVTALAPGAVTAVTSPAPVVATATVAAVPPTAVAATASPAPVAIAAAVSVVPATAVAATTTAARPTVAAAVAAIAPTAVPTTVPVTPATIGADVAELTMVSEVPTGEPSVIGAATTASLTSATESLTSLSVAVPAVTLQAGDTLVALLHSSQYADSSGDIASAGWNRIGPPRPTTITDATRLPSMMSHVVTTPGSEPAAYTFTLPAAASRVLGTMLVLRSDDGSPVLVAAASGTITGAPLAYGRKPGGLVFSEPTAALVIDVYAAAVLAGSATTITAPGAGSTELATVASGTDTAVTRTVQRVGARLGRGMRVDLPETYQDGATTRGPIAYQVAFARSGATRMSGRQWRLVLDERWKTDVAEGAWASSPYNAKYPAYDGWATTNSGSGTYRKTGLSVHDQKLDAHLSYVGGEYRSAGLIIGPAGYTGRTFGRYEMDIQADAIDGWKAAPLLWPNDPNYAAKGLAKADSWQGEIDFPEVDSLKSTAGIKAKHYQIYPDGVSRWSGWDDVGAVLCDGAVHHVVIEWTPDSVDYWLDGVHLGRSSGQSPQVPMRWTMQLEPIIGATPPTTADGHVYMANHRVWAPI